MDIRPGEITGFFLIFKAYVSNCFADFKFSSLEADRRSSSGKMNYVYIKPFML